MYIVFDIGGTKMRVAASADLDEMGKPVVHKTPDNDFNAGVQLLLDSVQRLIGEEHIDGIVGGIRGPLNKERTKLVRDNILLDWIDKPLAATLENKCSARVYLENDAALGALGEATRGAGKGRRIVAYLTVGTGVGGARIVNGRIDEVASGFEPGKQVIDADQTISSNSGNVLEDLISGGAIKRRFKKEPYEIEQNDPLWEELARWLAYGLKNTAVYWSPDVIVLGGPMVIGSPCIPTTLIRHHLKEELEPLLADVPEVKLAQLGDLSGLYGALEYGKQHFAL